MKKFFSAHSTIRNVLFVAAIIYCTTPYCSPPIALLVGLVFAQFIGHPFVELNHKSTSLLLKVSVVGLGFNMNVHQAMQAGKDGVIMTIASISCTIILGLLIGRAFKLATKTSMLVSSGTAICGGSAIAAVGPVMGASDREMSVALGTVFLLNSIALVIFPPIGHFFQLTQHQFGLWSAIAIHDTSSVVGAASTYGEEALHVATTVKLARALWIIPLAFGTAFFFKADKSKVKIPWFIGLFVVAMILNTYVPFIGQYSKQLFSVSKIGLTVTLFLIGAGLSMEEIKVVGWKPLVLGVILWAFISVTSFLVITRL
ncbi:MAG TPA: putative sulfate exporter family transporter [Bacteroidia bacterium]|nr:putative sulfate exporter family transporter [Bacteroidia bacterium]